MQPGIYLPSPQDDALHQVLSAWPADSHVLAFVPEADTALVSVLQALCGQLGLSLARAVFPELVAGPETHKQGLILIPLSGPVPLLIGEVSQADAPTRVAGQLGDYVETQLADNQEAALFTIFDALVPNIASHLDAWYLVLADRVHYVGVNGGSERFVSIPCLFDNQNFIADGLLALLLIEHPGGYLEHGYAIPETGMTASSADGNRIVQIDWRPALDVYREMMQSQYGVAIDADNFYSYAVHFPFGILRADGEVLVRIPVALDEQGGIICVGEIPAHSLLTLLDARASIDTACGHLLQDMSRNGLGDAHMPMLAFYCAGRRMHMGEAGVRQELGQLQAERPQLLGALSLGEVGASRSGGYPLFHNATLVGLPWHRD